MEQLILLQCVRDVSLLVNADEPTQVTQYDFDAAAEQAASNGGPRLPEAKRITERLRKKWREVLTIAHEPPEKHSHLLGCKEAEASAQDWLTEDYIKHVVRRVANRLGVTTLTRGEYGAERDAMLAEDARHWSHRRPLLLPSEDAIVGKLGDWDAALRLARLEVGVRPSRGPASFSRLDVMDLFYNEHGEQPSKTGLDDFARVKNICMSGEERRKWSETVKLWRQRRHDGGLTEPRVVIRRGGRSPRDDPDKTSVLITARPSPLRHSRHLRVALGHAPTFASGTSGATAWHGSRVTFKASRPTRTPRSAGTPRGHASRTARPRTHALTSTAGGKACAATRSNNWRRRLARPDESRGRFMRGKQAQVLARIAVMLRPVRAAIPERNLLQPRPHLRVRERRLCPRRRP